MILSALNELGPWNWMLLGFILLTLEIIVPGVFLLWIGIAAILTGALSLYLWTFDFWVWQVQVVLFLFLSLASVVIGKRLSNSRSAQSTDEPLLNMRAKQLVGRTAVLEDPMREGRGWIKLDDTIWRVSGPDLVAGTRVVVVKAEGTELTVESA